MNTLREPCLSETFPMYYRAFLHIIHFSPAMCTQHSANLGHPFSSDLQLIALYMLYFLDWCMSASLGHYMYISLFVPPFSTALPLSLTGTNGGMSPAGETCWKSSFQLLSPLCIPPIVPCFPSFFLPLFFLFSRCLFSVRVLRPVAEVICFGRAGTWFV